MSIPFLGYFLTLLEKRAISSIMINLTSKDYGDILHLIYNANNSENVETFIKSVSAPLAQLLRSECITFHLTEGRSPNFKVVESRSFKTERQNLYEDKYFPTVYKDSFFRHSPLLKEALFSKKNVLKIGESTSFKDWERSDMYNCFILPQKLYWEIFLAFRWKDNLEGMITLWRDRRQPDFGTAEMSKAEILVPHFDVAIHNICKMSMVNSWKNRLQSTEEGFLLLDRKLRLSYSNAKGAEICLQLMGLNPEGIDHSKGEFPIPSYITEDCTSLLDLLKVSNQPTLWPKERIVITENGCRFHIECSLIWKNGQMNSLHPYFMVNLTDIKPANNVQTKFNLSSREVDVLNCLIKGLPNSEIADRLFISKQTVHTHVKNIYKKVGIHGKIELIHNIQSENLLS